MIKRLAALVIFFPGILVVTLAGIGQAQLVLYDNFDSGPIDPAKWHGSQNQPGPSAPMTETIRRIVTGQLQLQVVNYGETTSDVGTAPLGIQALRVNDPSSVTAMQAKVVVQSAVAQACAANASTSQIRAGIFGSFFNDGSSTGPDDETGNVRVLFELRQQSGGTRTIRASITRCDDPGCDNSTNIDSHTFTQRWELGVARTLKLEWDAANDEFDLTVNPAAAGTETVSLSYSGISDADPPASDRKELRVQGLPVNCTAARRRTSITARFDNVMLDS
jgi:hypothetical protein